MDDKEKLEAECNQCRDPNCGLYGCMRQPASSQAKADSEFATKDDTYFEQLEQ